MEVELGPDTEEGKVTVMDASDLKPMTFGTNEDSKNHSTSERSSSLAPYQQLYTDEKVLRSSKLALYFALFSDAVNGTILQPNYPIMVLPPDHPEVHQDSFPSTAPFAFNAATYFLPMSSLLGVAIASVVIGRLSDLFGRKPLMLLCTYGSVVFTILMFFMKFNFWAFCGASFLNGLVSATVPVGMAYIGDVCPDKKAKEVEIGMIVGVYMLGNSGGGIVAILMETQGLFAPLWLGVALMAASAITVTFCLVEPRDILQPEKISMDEDDEEIDEEQKPPEKLDMATLVIIVLGALTDNIGSVGLMPLCLSPLAFKTFYEDFLGTDENPIMSQVAFKWISTLVAITVIPGTLIAPFFFSKIGTAGGCILGNVVTGISTIIILQIGLAPPTNASFGLFITILYLCFPFTVISQLSTGPMLDHISPVDKRGFVQGLNIMVMNLATSTTPFLFGIMADELGIAPTIWMCIGVSFLAAFVNLPLMFKKGLGIPPKPVPPEIRALKHEDEELVEKALRGEVISIEDIEVLNEIRRQKGKPYLVLNAGSYESDKNRLAQLREQARDDYNYSMEQMDRYLVAVTNADDTKGLLDSVNKSYNVNPELAKTSNSELGQWFADYLADSGYTPYTFPQLTKQMIMTAFPPISYDDALTPENAENILLNCRRVYRRFAQLEDLPDEDTVAERVRKLLARGGRPTSSSRAIAF